MVTAILFIAVIAIAALAACGSQRAEPEAETKAIVHVYDAPIEKTVHEPPQAEPDPNIIDHIFTKSISDTLPPLNFRVLGEVFSNQHVRINSVIISDNSGAQIQELRVGASPRNATENNHLRFLSIGTFLNMGKAHAIRLVMPCRMGFLVIYCSKSRLLQSVVLQVLDMCNA